MERIAIIGLGQIGSSIGLAIKRGLAAQKPDKPDVEVVGHDREPGVAAAARGKGAVDRTFYSLPQTVEEASLVIVAVPVLAIRDVLGVIAPVLKEGTIVTDTGSTKARVLGWAEELLPASVSFVGGHPMAGSEIPGVEGARADLFDGAVYCLVPSAQADPDAVRSMTDLTVFLGGKPFFVDADEHDGLVAAISHLPIALSITLMNMAYKAPVWRELGYLAAGSFRDVSRLASGDPAMQRDILATNGKEVVRWIDAYIEELRLLREQIKTGDERELLAELRGAWRARQRWQEGRLAPEEEPTSDELQANLGSQMEQLLVGNKARQILRELFRPRQRS